jgi:hypothetical protein
LGNLSEVSRAYDKFYKVRLAPSNKAERGAGLRKLQVCDVCGAYLSRLDNDRRLADHFYGKMHLGYAK